MKRVVLKSGIVAVTSALTSLAIASLLVPALGGRVDGTAWLMCIACPLLIAWPASGWTFYQSARLRHAHRELSIAHEELATAHRRLSEKTRFDNMTGVLNRETFLAALEGSSGKPERGALLVIDADHFKKINDSYGHLAGDQALREIAAAMARGVRAGDLLGRIGGEEFAAFLPGATLEEAEVVAERIRCAVEAIDFRPDRSAPVPLTVSIGGTYCRPLAPVAELMRGADRRLYEAKRKGRNRAVLAQRRMAA